MTALPTLAKGLMVALLMSPAGALDAQEPGLLPSQQPAALQSAAPLPCALSQPFRFDAEHYRRQTRAQLRELGRQGDPVGLYYQSHEDLRAGDAEEARRKLLRAADAGLRAAY
ncbi:MAG: hypothetical protein WBF53_00115, partial [Litorimonas sp.]